LIDVVSRNGASFVAMKPTFHFVLQGRCHLRADDGAFEAALEDGDFVVVPHARRHTVSDAPDVPAMTAQHAQRAQSPLARDIPVVLRSGDGAPVAFRLLSGVFQFPSQTARPIVAALPPLLRRPRARIPTAGMLADLIDRSATAPGGRAFVLRLADLM